MNEVSGRFLCGFIGWFLKKITDKCHIIMILTYTSFTNFWIDSSEVFISVQEHTCNLRGDVFLKSRRLRKRGENNSGVVNWRHAATFKTTNITTSLSTGDICVCCKVCRDHSEILRHLCCCTQLHTKRWWKLLCEESRKNRENERTDSFST